MKTLLLSTIIFLGISSWLPLLAAEGPATNSEAAQKEFWVRVDALTQENLAQFQKDYPLFKDLNVAGIQELASLDTEKRADFFNLRPTAGESAVVPKGASNCFDDYTFGSVDVDVVLVAGGAIPGMSLPFQGKLKNSNTYPLIDGSVYVKIFKKEGDDGKFHRNGHPLVAFFEVGKDIALPALGEKDFSFEWQVPMNLAGGEYEAAFFFLTKQRFNLLGLSFTDDIVGNQVGFVVESASKNQVVFDKNSVTLNGESYAFAAFPPRFPKDEAVTASMNILNPGSETRYVALRYTLYNWDGIRPENRLDEKTELISLPPGATKTVSYEAKKYRGSVSYLLAEVRDGDATSLLNIRFVRDGIDEVRLNFPSITSFPIEEGKEMAVFSCAHSTNLPQVDNTEISMILIDDHTKETLANYTYTGPITGAMMGIRKAFVPKRTSTHVNLTTVLTKDGKPVDSVTQTYDCEKIDPKLCEKEGKNPVEMDEPSNKTIFFVTALIVFLGILFGLLWKVTRRKKDQLEVS